MNSIASLQTALSGNPENWETRYRLILALHQEGRTDEAVELLNEIENLPSDERSLVYAAQSYQILGGNEPAADVYQMALALNPASEAAKSGLRSLGIKPGEASPEQSSAPESAPLPASINSEDIAPFDPESASLVDHIQEAELESLKRHQSAIRRDRINSVIATVLIHVGIVLALGLVIQKIPRRVPPQIVASSSAETNEPSMEKQTVQKNTLKATNPAESAAADILSVPSVSAVSLTSLDAFTGTDMPMETGMTFQPSVSMGMPSSSNSMMMFGQPLEGETLGVILDVSGSMAEWLPLVIREVDRNFDDAPIVYIRNAMIRGGKDDDLEVRPVVAEEVVRNRWKDGRRSPYHFLWDDLPRKAPQRAVDRLIETMRTRPNQFLVLGRGDLLGAAMKFLTKENCDALYVFSDFEDFVDEDAAQNYGQFMAQSKVRAYIQPAVEESEFIKVAAHKIARRTKGRQLPTLASIVNPEMTEPAPIMVSRPKTGPPEIPGVTYANPRTEMYGKQRHHRNPDKNWKEIGRHDCPEFTAVFYGPTARAFIYLKNKKGQYIQRPFTFGYHSRKYHPDIPDPRYRWKTRKFLRNAEPPKFDGKEIVWKMILEDEISFDVYMYLDRRGMNATYVAQPPDDGKGDGAHIGFGVPQLAVEYKDRYYGQDCPEGLNLDTVRQYANPNVVIFNLPRQERDRFAKGWAVHGFEPGYNTRHFDELITRFPGGMRSLEIQGPSFGDRVFQARTTSSKIYLGSWTRGDTEPWEGFSATLSRAGDVRTRFTKTEAIAFSIEEKTSGGLGE
ncbi:MAG: tetratricopeptide repeat protein [Verrucomicrobiales bacterium]|nr:tetratricopeptide repeat protein [Verrucomicrobiales bacterium]